MPKRFDPTKRFGSGSGFLEAPIHYGDYHPVPMARRQYDFSAEVSADVVSLDMRERTLDPDTPRQDVGWLTNEILSAANRKIPSEKCHS